MLFIVGLFVLAVLGAYIVTQAQRASRLLRLIPSQLLLLIVFNVGALILMLFDIELDGALPMIEEGASTRSFIEPALLTLGVALLVFGGFFLRALWLLRTHAGNGDANLRLSEKRSRKRRTLANKSSKRRGR